MVLLHRKKGYYTEILHKQELDAYLLLLKEIVNLTKARDLDHHEFYDENIEEQFIDETPILAMEDKLAEIEQPN